MLSTILLYRRTYGRSFASYDIKLSLRVISRHLLYGAFSSRYCIAFRAARFVVLSPRIAHDFLVDSAVIYRPPPVR